MDSSISRRAEQWNKECMQTVWVLISQTTVKNCGDGRYVVDSFGGMLSVGNRCSADDGNKNNGHRWDCFLEDDSALFWNRILFFR